MGTRIRIPSRVVEVPKLRNIKIKIERGEEEMMEEEELVERVASRIESKNRGADKIQCREKHR